MNLSRSHSHASEKKREQSIAENKTQCKNELTSSVLLAPDNSVNQPMPQLIVFQFDFRIRCSVK